MGSGALQYCRLTLETTYGAYDVTQHSTANEIFIHLEGDNACTVRPTPVFATIRSANSFNRRAKTYNPRYTVGGGLSTSLYPTQSAFLMNWATVLTSNDLPSVTIDHFDGVRARAYLGCKVDQLGLVASSAEDSGVKASFTLTAQSVAASNANFLLPAASAFPAEAPWLFQELAGGLTIGGARTKFKSFNLTFKNILAKPQDELPTISNCYFSGRDLDLTAAVQYLASSDRTTLETNPPGALAMTAIFTKASPSHVLTLDFKSTNFLMSVADDLPLGGAEYQTLNVSSYWDRTAGTDFAYTYT